MGISLRKKHRDGDNQEVITVGKRDKKQSSKLLTIFMCVLLMSLAVGAGFAYEGFSILKQDEDSKEEFREYLQRSNFKYYVRNLSDELIQVFNGNALNRNVQGLKYYVKDLESDKSITNIDNGIEHRIISKSDDYVYYLYMKQDRDGNYRVVENKGIAQGRFNSSDIYDEDNLRYEFIYYIEDDYLTYNDDFGEMVIYHVSDKKLMLAVMVGIITAFITLLFTLFISYKREERILGFRLYNKLYLELKFGLCILVALLMPGSVALFRNLFGTTSMFYPWKMMYYRTSEFYIMYGFNVVIANILVMFNVVFIKYIYHNGIVNGLFKNSLVVKSVIRILSLLKKSYKKTSEFIVDILVSKDDAKTKKMLGKILCLHCTVLFAIAFLGPFGGIIAILYTVFLFKFFMEYISQLKSLNKSVEELTEGNFDVEFTQKVALLESLIERLNLIKNGLKVAVEKETKSERLRVELISNVSHDLRTPLTSIINYVDLMGKEELTATQEEYIEILNKKSQRLRILIDDLFEVSKASSGSVELNITDIDIVSLLRQTMAEFEDSIDESQLKFKLNIPEDKLICSLDGKKTFRIFENLISNILKYSLTGSRVYIDIIDEENQVSIVFKNISAYEMDFEPTEIMNRLSRGDKSRNTEGSGLGLAIAKSLVILQGGKIDLVIDGDLFKLSIIFPR